MNSTMIHKSMFMVQVSLHQSNDVNHIMYSFTSDTQFQGMKFFKLFSIMSQTNDKLFRKNKVAIEAHTKIVI